jgi:hypothetical protein
MRDSYWSFLGPVDRIDRSASRFRRSERFFDVALRLATRGLRALATTAGAFSTGAAG